MSKASTQPARGMRDFLPADVRRRRFVIQTIASVYERYGFEPLETPAFENIETLLGKYGEEGDRLIFRILKRGEEGKTGDADLALRTAFSGQRDECHLAVVVDLREAREHLRREAAQRALEAEAPALGG